LFGITADGDIRPVLSDGSDGSCLYCIMGRPGDSRFLAPRQKSTTDELTAYEAGAVIGTCFNSGYIEFSIVE